MTTPKKPRSSPAAKVKGPKRVAMPQAFADMAAEAAALRKRCAELERALTSDDLDRWKDQCAAANRRAEAAEKRAEEAEANLKTVTESQAANATYWLNKSERLVARSQRLESALRQLASEAHGFLSMADREVHGNTNINVLRLRIDEARAALGAEPTGEAGLFSRHLCKTHGEYWTDDGPTCPRCVEGLNRDAEEKAALSTEPPPQRCPHGKRWADDCGECPAFTDAGTEPPHEPKTFVDLAVEVLGPSERRWAEKVAPQIEAMRAAPVSVPQDAAETCAECGHERVGHVPACIEMQLSSPTGECLCASFKPRPCPQPEPQETPEQTKARLKAKLDAMTAEEKRAFVQRFEDIDAEVRAHDEKLAANTETCAECGHDYDPIQREGCIAPENHPKPGYVVRHCGCPSFRRPSTVTVSAEAKDTGDEPYSWDRCTHKGIGLLGCATCDPDKNRCLWRARIERERAVAEERRAIVELVRGEIRIKNNERGEYANGILRTIIADIEARSHRGEKAP